MHLIEDHAKKADIPVRFAACKLAEGDELILEQLKLDENEKQLLEHIVKQMEQNVDLTGPQQLQICVLHLLRRSVMLQL